MAESQIFLAEQGIQLTRDRLAQMRRLARADDEHDGIELFTALCGYLDQLSGPPGFDHFLPPADRQRVASMIMAISDRSATESVDQNQQPLSVRRLRQPVNAAVTLDEGRELAARLARSADWQAELGLSVLALYDYLDELHGGRFTELLNSAERIEVAEMLAGAAPAADGDH